MSDHTIFKYSNAVLAVPIIAVLFIWGVYWFEIRFHINLNDFGLYPRKFTGLKGVVFSPFIHGSLEHLYNNTIPLALLLASLFYFYRGIAYKVLIVGAIVSGLITWTIGRPSFHIGASGVIYLLASFIFFKGVFTKYYRLVAVSLIVVFIYGSLLWYIFPTKDGISWEGHLGGFITGLLLAFLIKAQVPTVKKYAWERDDYNEQDDEFLQHFDENGNFIEQTKAPEEPEENPLRITYHFKSTKEDAQSDEV